MAFGKYIQSQCAKGKAVDTQLVGLFIPKQLMGKEDINADV